MTSGKEFSTSRKVMNIEGLQDGVFGLSSLSEIGSSDHLQVKIAKAALSAGLCGEPTTSRTAVRCLANWVKQLAVLT